MFMHRRPLGERPVLPQTERYAAARALVIRDDGSQANWSAARRIL
jgi:hypothetical protein